jgi:predicted phosphodiesterase
LRIGIVSDVHGNAAGLALALALDRMGEVDLLLCAGDRVEEYRFSNETVALLRDHDATCVLGNHDIGILAAHGHKARSAPHVDPSLVEWLASHDPPPVVTAR